MSFLGIVSVILAFSILVLIHELGHYLAARWMGVRVERFSIGFPPVLFSKKIGDTEFCISAIPLGGYVKMAGFVDESMDTKVTGADDEYSSKPVWKRIIIIIAGVIMNLILAIGIYTGLNYSQGELINPVTTVKVTDESGVAKKIGLETGDKILSINGESTNDFTKVMRLFFENMETGVQFEIIRDEQQLTLSYDKNWLRDDKGEYLDIMPLLSARVGDVSPDMPASELGLEKGDLITRINDLPVNSWDEMTEIIRANGDVSLDISWIRDQTEMTGKITPQKVYGTDENGTDISYGLIGIGYYYIHNPISFGRALELGFTQPFEIIYLNIKGLKWWISGVKTAQETIGGPVMIAKLAGDAAERGWFTYLSLLAALSSVLAFFNILPIPALDGGHLSFLLVEAVMGRPLSLKTRLVIQQVGMALLLSFIIFVLYVDFNRLFF